MYYDYDGQPITMEQWGELYQHERHVAETTLEDGTYISTVWLGLDHSFGSGPPLIYETMVFRDGDGDECERYTYRHQAVEGHKLMVMRVTNPDLEAMDAEQEQEAPAHTDP